MIAYLDASILLRIMLNEPAALPEFKKIKLAVSSTLIKIECLRILDRLKNENQFSDEEFLEAKSLFMSTFRRIHFIPMSSPVVEVACQSWGVPLRSLDSIHLASAILWKRNKDKDLLFLTHDRKLGLAAKAFEFEVLGIE